MVEPLPMTAAPLTESFAPGEVVPMPTLPLIIAFPSDTTVVSYELPIANPPDTDSFAPGFHSPMPTSPPSKFKLSSFTDVPSPSTP